MYRLTRARVQVFQLSFLNIKIVKSSSCLLKSVILFDRIFLFTTSFSTPSQPSINFKCRLILDHLIRSKQEWASNQTSLMQPFSLYRHLRYLSPFLCDYLFHSIPALIVFPTRWGIKGAFYDIELDDPNFTCFKSILNVVFICHCKHYN